MSELSYDDDSFIATSSSESSFEWTTKFSSKKEKKSVSKKSNSNVSTRDPSPSDKKAKAKSESSSQICVLSDTKSRRKSALDSLVKKRARVSVIESESSIESNEDSFLASSNDSECENDPGFYSRVTSSIDRKEMRSSLGSSNGLSFHEAFRLFVQHYAVCLVSKSFEFPVSRFKHKGPMLVDAARRVEKDLTARRDNARPSYWKSDSLLLAALNGYTVLRIKRLSRREWSDGQCFGCSKVGYSVETNFTGKFYDSVSLWKGDLKKWATKKVEPSKTIKSYASDTLTFGGKCCHNCYVYHSMQHSKHCLLSAILKYVEKQNDPSPEDILQLIKDDVRFTDKMYDKYLEYKRISESQYTEDNYEIW